MFDGLYLQFPKLGFLLFFFLACEALCPLRSNAFYFPRTTMFGTVGVKPPLWLWIAKWGMITFLLVALMSPVRDHKMVHYGDGWDILLVLDPELIETKTLNEVSSFIDQRSNERIALWIPDNTVVPLTYEHEVLKSILSHSRKTISHMKVDRTLSRFFATSPEGRGLSIIFSNHPETFIHTLPIGIQVSVFASNISIWKEEINKNYPPYLIHQTHRYFEYYYVYPLFFGFVSMLLYLYGRNQKGLK
ncbi:MAG: hypothetical protein PHO27_03590 [Sulfuricurvum sp.]|nr:hypothetical protein [Sulfuricurvum sp.]